MLPGNGRVDKSCYKSEYDQGRVQRTDNSDFKYCLINEKECFIVFS